jgi:hypothetical protein
MSNAADFYPARLRRAGSVRYGHFNSRLRLRCKQQVKVEVKKEVVVTQP